MVRGPPAAVAGRVQTLEEHEDNIRDAYQIMRDEQNAAPVTLSAT
jgi:hypothetical protein